MSLADEAIPRMNSLFTTVNLPLKIIELTCWRPAFQNSYFQDYEPIHNVDRLFECDPVYVTLFIEYEERRYEYELRYRNDKETLKLSMFKLNYCQYGPDEDVFQIESNMIPIVGLLAITIPAIFALLATR